MSFSPLISTAGRLTVLHEESFSQAGISSNVYILSSGEKHYLFDAGGHPSLLSFLEAAGISRASVAGLFLTHGHYDHVRGASSLLSLRVPIYLEEADHALAKECLGKSCFNTMEEGLDLLKLLGFEMVKAPGHTPGSVCFYSRKDRLLISGDTVFADGIFGRTDLPGGSGDSMIASLKLLSRLDVELLLPGHGLCLAEGGNSSIITAYGNAKCILGRG
jgi:glyoxylase-like metal-dependent hydrolase (beta-lactamase superfamily II)